MTDELTRRIQTLEGKIVNAINEADLPPIVVDLMLSNLLYEVREAKKSYDPQVKEVVVNDEILGNGNPDPS